MAQGLIVIEAGEEFDYVYFPHYGMLSLLAVLKDGKPSRRQRWDAKG